MVHDYTEQIVKISKEIFHKKKELRIANENTICDNGNSIADNLFYLKQITSEYRSCLRYLTDEKVTRNSTGYGNEVEYREVNYSTSWMKEYLEEYKKEINEVQNNIDRANLNTKI